jgi:UDP-glucose 4-epimerase
MTVCILGGTGFLGRHLCERLHKQGRRAVVTSRAPDQAFITMHAPSVTAIPIDDPRVWGEIATAKVFIYLGGSSLPSTSWRAPTHEIEANVLSAVSVIRRVLDVNPSCHIVYASSGGQIYGPGHARRLDEATQVEPATAYALGKQLVEATLGFFSRTEGAVVTILRIANPVGKWQLGGRHGFVSAAVNAQFTGRPITIHGDGKNERDYFDADELAELLESFATSNHRSAGIYNIGSGRSCTEREVIATIESVTGLPVPYITAPARPFDLRYAVLDASRAAIELGWRSSTPLEDIVVKLREALDSDVLWRAT